MVAAVGLLGSVTSAQVVMMVVKVVGMTDFGVVLVNNEMLFLFKTHSYFSLFKQ